MAVYHAQLDKDNKVFCMSELYEKVDRSDMIVIDEYNTNLIGCLYKDGKFIGIKIVVEADRHNVKADGIDAAVITAKLIDVPTGQVVLDSDRFLVFKLNSHSKEGIISKTKNGVVTIDFTTLEKGEFIINVLNDGTDITKNGFVTVIAE